MKNNIKDLRKLEKITQAELAEQVEVTRQTIIAIEQDKYDPSLQLAFKLAHFFETTVDQLFEYNSTFAAQNRQVHLNIIGQTRKPLL